MLTDLIKKLYNDSRIRYIFFGGLTTVVNIVVFALLEGPLGIDYKMIRQLYDKVKCGEIRWKN